MFRGRLVESTLGHGLPFKYYGTKGALEVEAWNRELLIGGSDAPPGFKSVRVYMKSWLNEPFSGARHGEFFLVDRNGNQIKALNRSDILRQVWSWVYENGGIDAYSPPEVILPKSRAEFRILFPKAYSGSLVKLVYMLGSDYMLEVPIWENYGAAF